MNKSDLSITNVKTRPTPINFSPTVDTFAKGMSCGSALSCRRHVKTTIGVWVPSDFGGRGGGRKGAVTLLPEKDYKMPESMCCTNALKSQ